MRASSDSDHRSAAANRWNVPRSGESCENGPAMNGTKLVFILVGGAIATVLIFQGINYFS